MNTTDTPSQPPPFSPFAYGSRHRELSGAILKRLQEVVDTRRSRMIASRNAFSYRHGGEWSLSHSPDSGDFAKFQSVRAESEVNYQDVVDHNLLAIRRYIEDVADKFEQQFLASLFELINETTEATGNIVSFSGDAADGMMQMLEKVELGVDEHGHPSMPQLHTSPENSERIRRDLEAQPRDFWERWEQVRAEKEAGAIAHEAARISRFRL